MKKNFVKKTLASTLALAMVATATPAAFTTASAAKAPALNKTSKTLYINDNEIGSSFDFNISNKVAKSTYKWTTSNKAVATVNSKGLTKAATKTGKATISCKITLPTKKTKTLKATVTVKENATKVWVKNAPEKEIGIGEKAYDFNSSFSTASGATATDYRTWEIDKDSNTAGATIDAKSGVVTTTKAGEFKVRVRAYQNKAKLAANDTVDSEWLTVKVVSSLVSTKQSATNKVELTFDDSMKDKVKATDFDIKNKATNVVNAIKGISLSDDGKVVTVETFGDYADAATYVLTYAGKDVEFTTSIGEVATIEVAKPTVFPNEATEIKYVLKNANGVDITSAKKSTVVIEQVENKNGYLDGDKLTIFDKDKTAKIKITYHTYKYENGAETGKVEQEFVFTCIDKTAATVGAYKQYTITDKNSINWAKVTTTSNTLCKNDTKWLHVQAKDSNDKDVTGLTFSSSNDNVLMVDTDGTSAKLIALKEGSAYVIVKNEKGVVLWSLPVTIKGESKASQISTEFSSKTVSNFAGAEPTYVSVTVKNQFSDDIGAKGKFNVSPVSTSSPATLVTDNGDGKLKINTKLADGTSVKAGNYEYWVTLNDNKNVKVKFAVTVLDASDTDVKTYKVEVDNNYIDMNTTKAEAKTVTAKVVGYNAKGVAVEYTKCPITVYKPDGKVLADQITTTATSAAVDVVSVTASNEAVKLPTGTYRVVATVPNGSTTQEISAGFIVNDTQAAPTFTVEKVKSEAGNTLAAAKECFKIKSSEGKDLTIDSLSADSKINGSTVYIPSVYVYETISYDDNGVDKTVTVKHEVKVSTTITFK